MRRAAAIFRFELAYQARRAWPWLIFATVLWLSFLMARDLSVADAMYEEFFANSPFAIAKSTVIGGLAWLLLATPIAGDAGARDVATGMYPLVYTLPVSRGAYLGGRLLAALALDAVLLLAVPLGILLGVYLPGVDAAVIGPFRPAAFLTAYALIALPNAVVAVVLQFALAQRSGRAMSSFAASVLLVFTGFFVASVLNFLVRPGLGTLLDPIGLHFVIDDLAYDWTPLQRNTRLLALEGTVLRNRALWLGIAAATFAFTWARFRFAHRAERGRLWRPTRRRERAGPPTPATVVAPAAAAALPRAPRTFGVAFHLRQTLAVARASFRAIAGSRAGLAMLVGLPLLAVPVVIGQSSSLGTPLLPTTAQVVRQLVGGLTAELAAEPSRWMIVPLLVVYFAGELVWRERDAGLGAITDAMPGSEWAPFLGKLLGLWLVLALLMASLAAAGMVAQTILGFHEYQPGLYLQTLLGLQLAEHLLFAVLALAVHALVHRKYVGHLVAVLAYAWVAVLAGALGIEHNLLVFGRGPGWSYTEMRGFGGSLGPWAWFRLYWGAWAVLLAVAARLLWVRGDEHGWRPRLRIARDRLTGPTRLTAMAAGLLVIASGAWIFRNTNVLNAYRSRDAVDDRRAEYERRYGKYEHVPQPRLTRASVRVELHPARRAAAIRGRYTLVNRATTAIDTVQVAMATGGAGTRAMTFDRPATLVVDDREHAHRAYALARPLAPGDTLRLDFDVRIAPRGFGNRGVDPSLTARGSHFTNEAWFPALGYQPRRALVTPAARRAHGLAPRPLLAALHGDDAADAATPAGEGVVLETTIGTDEDQVAVAPGALRREWREGGRRWFAYATSAPIGSEWAFFSAPYAVHEEKWRDVAIRIYHDPRHATHVEHTMESVRAALDYYTEQFGPYRWDHLAFVERPGAPGSSLHADASVISHGESFAAWRPRDEPGALDVPYAIVGHEVAHQWGMPYAMVEGLPFLSEGLATYSAMRMVAASRGPGPARRFRAFTRQPYPYPPIRRGEPLLRAMDPYLAYRRGPFAMWALSAYAGEAAVNGAIRRLYESHRAPGSATVTTLDLYRELRAAVPDTLQPLLHDLFEINAFWDLRVERVTTTAVDSATWRVTLDVSAHKKAYDSAGVVTELPMREWVPIGVFARPAKGHDRLSAPLYLRMHQLRSGRQTITVTVRGKPPVLAGVDPDHLLDWEEGEEDDNVRAVRPRE